LLNLHTIKEKAEDFLVASNEIGLEVNVDKTKYMFMSREQAAERSHSMNIDNSSFEIVEEFNYLRTTMVYQYSNQEVIKSRLKSGNAWCHSGQQTLCSSLLSKNLKIKIYRNIILPVILYGNETWSMTLREDCRLRVFETRMLRGIFGPKRVEVTRECRELHNEELH
jgi:hypothetical protein